MNSFLMYISYYIHFKECLKAIIVAYISNK